MTIAPSPLDRESIWLTEDRPDAGELGLCVHCGFCLNACPTYHDLGVETDSPRGRIALMRGLDDGRIEWSPRVQQHFDQCLQCRACETACPSKVPYGRLMEATRAEAFAQNRWPRRQRVLWRLVMHGVFPYPRLMRLAGYGLKLYQRTGLQALVRKTGLLARLSPRLADIDSLSPVADNSFYTNNEAAQVKPTARTGPTPFRSRRRAAGRTSRSTVTWSATTPHTRNERRRLRRAFVMCTSISCKSALPPQKVESNEPSPTRIPATSRTPRTFAAPLGTSCAAFRG